VSHDFWNFVLRNLKGVINYFHSPYQRQGQQYSEGRHLVTMNAGHCLACEFRKMFEGELELTSICYKYSLAIKIKRRWDAHPLQKFKLNDVAVKCMSASRPAINIL
jgi:hypothetical protein